MMTNHLRSVAGIVRCASVDQQVQRFQEGYETNVFEYKIDLGEKRSIQNNTKKIVERLLDSMVSAA